MGHHLIFIELQEIFSFNVFPKYFEQILILKIQKKREEPYQCVFFLKKREKQEDFSQIIAETIMRSLSGNK